MKEDMLQCFNRLREDDSIREPNFTLESPIPDISIKDNFTYTMSPNIDAPIDVRMSDLKKKIDLFICLLLNNTSSPSHKDVTNSVMPDPPISFPQRDEFKEGKKSAGDVSAHVDKSHKDTFDVDEQDEFMESDVMSSTESIVDPKVKVNSPNSNPTSL